MEITTMLSILRPSLTCIVHGKFQCSLECITGPLLTGGSLSPIYMCFLVPLPITLNAYVMYSL